MARQILSPIDFRTQAQRQGVTQNQQTIQAITDILKTVGAAEEKRRERQTLDRIVRAIGQGKTDAEAIAAVAEQGPEFGGGIPGVLQRVGGFFQPSQGQGDIKQSIQKKIIGDALTKALSPQREIPSGLVPAGATVGPKGGLTTRFARPEAPISPTAQTQTEKDLDRDIKILTARHKSGGRKGQLIATGVQQEAARRRARANENIGDISPGQMNYSSFLKSKPRVKTGTFDEAFGEKAYDQALQEAQNQGLAQGATEASVEADFNAWWDKQVAEESGDTFIEFVPREKFKGKGKKVSSPQGLAGPQLPGGPPEGIRPKEKVLTDVELRSLLAEVGGDVEKARELAEQRGWTIPK